ncbi:hypothetical protein HDV06_001934 [Boothiomyces sp. JEL0866]|nr:hypothetical protein HDV06_001934 [Boothiomyces sp. JEL0866]
MSNAELKRSKSPSKESKKKQKTGSEKDQFIHSFEEIKRVLLKDLDDCNLPANGKEWFKQMFDETVQGGKMNRGLTVASALQSLVKRSLNEKELYEAHVLGWCIEMENVGMIAINDSFIIESAIYKLLKRYFKSHPAYVEFLELFHETTFQTELGQLMDLITAPEGDVDLSRFSIEKHAYIVEYKTAYYSFYLPIALAMRYAGVTDESAYDQAKKVLLALGEYFQVQDDYLDCYGLPEVIGKIGTDIEDNKCGWLIVQALSLANKAQREILDNNYGQKDPAKVALVKQVYKELDIEGVYNKYEEDSYQRITALIAEIDDSLIPQDMFTKFMNR